MGGTVLVALVPKLTILRFLAFSTSAMVMGCVRKRDLIAFRVDLAGLEGGRTGGAAIGGGLSNNLTLSKRLSFDGSNSSSD